MVQALRNNVPGKPARRRPLESSRYSLVRKVAMTLAVFASLFVIDLIHLSWRARAALAAAQDGTSPPAVVMAVGRYADTVDAAPACLHAEMASACRHVTVHLRSRFSAQYSLRVAFEPLSARPRVDLRGPWWFNQPFVEGSGS